MKKDPFTTAIRQGLGCKSKFIPSMWFYDANGCKIFEEILDLPEYYIPQAEHEIITNSAEYIASELPDEYNIIELGAGNGNKAINLIQNLNIHSPGCEICYYPVDISSWSNQQLRNKFEISLPGIPVKKVNLSFLQGLKGFVDCKKPRLVMFLGSSIGNMTITESIKFLKEVRATLSKGDLFFITFDLVKSPEIILPAYNDSQGVTARFNLNLLTRINKRFQGNFILDNFRHTPVYNSELARAESYLKSTKAQKVYLKKLKLTIKFRAGELIHTEISQKYDTNSICHVCTSAGFGLVDSFFDNKIYCNGRLLRA